MQSILEHSSALNIQAVRLRENVAFSGENLAWTALGASRLNVLADSASRSHARSYGSRGGMPKTVMAEISKVRSDGAGVLSIHWISSA